MIIYPLWLGSMPALLKGFLEQVFRPGFATSAPGVVGMPRGLLTGRSAPIVVTMGMPTFFHRWYFRAHSLKALRRNILRFCGIGPITESLIGAVAAGDNAKREAWLARIRALGKDGRQETGRRRSVGRGPMSRVSLPGVALRHGGAPLAQSGE